LRGAFFEAWQIYPSEVSIFSAGEAEASSGGDQLAQEYPARLIRVKRSGRSDPVHHGCRGDRFPLDLAEARLSRRLYAVELF
jgi:hypothetical protein